MPRDRSSAEQAQAPADRTAEPAQLLPELAVALYEPAPQHARMRPETDPQLTGRQMEAVVFLDHQDRATMGNPAAGLGISRGGASERVERLVEKKAVRREPDAADRRVVLMRLAGRADALAGETRARWRAALDPVFAHYPSIDPEDLVPWHHGRRVPRRAPQRRHGLLRRRLRRGPGPAHRVPESKGSASVQTLDLPGDGLASVSLLCLTLRLIEGQRLGWTSATIVGLFVVSADAFVLFCLPEDRVPRPLIDFSLVRNVDFAAGMPEAARTLVEALFRGWFTDAINTTFIVGVGVAAAGGFCALLLRSHVASADGVAALPAAEVNDTGAGEDAAVAAVGRPAAAGVAQPDDT